MEQKKVLAETKPASDPRAKSRVLIGFALSLVLILPAAAQTAGTGKTTTSAKPTTGKTATAKPPDPKLGKDAKSTATADKSAAPAKPAAKPSGDIIGDLIGKAGAIAADPSSAVQEGSKFLNTVAGSSFGVKTAVQLLTSDGAAQAITAAKALPDLTDRKLALWLISTSGDPMVTSSMISDAMTELKDWPGQNLLRLRFELAFVKEMPDPATVIRVLGTGSAPVSEGGTVALAEAYKALGRSRDAADLVRPYWRNSRFSEDTEKALLADFSDVLTKDDHKARVDRLLYDGRADDALRTARFLDKDDFALADAWAAVLKRNAQASAKLAAVPASARKDPSYTFANAQQFRRQGRYAEAASAMLSAPTDPKLLVDPDAWSVERRALGRKLIEGGQSDAAYRVVASHSAQSRTEKVEAEWDAGWYAFRYLNDPARAEQHFRAIEQISTAPLSQSRAEYWLGRTAEAQGMRDAAADHFQKAAQFQTAFYGQLALQKLKVSQLSISGAPVPDAAAKKRFQDRELVKALGRLNELERSEDAAIFYRALVDRLTDPIDLVLLAGMAERAGDHQWALITGKFAQSKGFDMDALAFPTAAIPRLGKDVGVEVAAIYAVARQESSFDVAATSSAGALGLMQLMPGTAKETAGSLGMPYTLTRLTTDPGYNATLGSAHLASLVNDFGGSYALAFAAYNAGKSRVLEWIRLNGDPRDPKVDPIDWIEKIPFNETRNYVERTLENLQVYRARVGSPTLRLTADMTGARS